MKKVLRTISWILAVTSITLVLLALVCPLKGSMTFDAVRTAPSLCTKDVGNLINPNSTGLVKNYCLDFHSTLLNKISGIIPETMGVFALLISMVSIVYFVFSRSLFNAHIKSLLARLRHYFYRYSTAIKLLREKKFLYWLKLVDNRLVASDI